MFSNSGRNKLMAERKKQPVHEERFGVIRAAIWANSSDKGVRYNVTFSRLYKDGTWKDSTSFGRDDLLVVAKVADWAHTWIFKHAKAPDDPEWDEP